MKKALLPIVIGTILAGCGSDSNETPKAPDTKMAAIFMDRGAVEGVRFDCNNTDDKGTTSEIGQFKVSEGAVCDFSLDGYYLGTNREPITEENNQINAYTLEYADRALMRTNNTSTPSQEQYVSNVSALLQSIDKDPSVLDSIDTTAVVGASLSAKNPLAATHDAEFEEAMLEVEMRQEDGTTSAIKDIPNMVPTLPSEAKEGLNDQYTSENVQDIINSLKTILAGNITEVNIESTLNEYRTLLIEEDGSNGYHQKALDAILEIIEIANMPEVANRVTITGSEYSEMLAKALDIMVTPGVDAEFIETVTGTTEDVSKVLAEAAARLKDASIRLGAAMPGEGYVMPYSDEDDALTYQDSLVIRTGALALANTLYTIASYNAGDDAHYLPQETTLSNVDIVINTHDGNSEWEDAELTELEVEFDTFSSDPLAYVQSPEVLAYHTNAEERLNSAKESLVNALLVAQLINLEDYLNEDEVEEVQEILMALSGHLEGSKDYLEIDGTYINLHAFYSTEQGVDRSDFDIINPRYVCEFDSRDGEAVYDVNISKVLGEAMCSHTANYLVETENNTYVRWELLTHLESSYNDGIYQETYIKAVPADLEYDIIESSSSNLTDVVWCGFEDNKKLSCFDED